MKVLENVPEIADFEHSFGTRLSGVLRVHLVKKP